MNIVTVYYATHDGHSERIARRVAARLSERGAAPLVSHASAPIETRGFASAAILAVRYGNVLPAGAAFLRRYAACGEAPPLALALVNLVARDPARRTPETNPYLRKVLTRYGLRPAIATAFGGRLNYPQYGFVDKQMIRLIMAMTGGVADGRSDIDYTDWAQVDAFAGEVAALRGAGEPAGA